VRADLPEHVNNPVDGIQQRSTPDDYAKWEWRSHNDEYNCAKHHGQDGEDIEFIALLSHGDIFVAVDTLPQPHQEEHCCRGNLDDKTEQSPRHPVSPVWCGKQPDKKKTERTQSDGVKNL